MIIEKGTAISKGYAFGNAYILKNEKISINFKKIKLNNVEKEIEKFLISIKKTIKEYKKIKSKIKNKDKKILFDGYILILNDKSINNDIINLIKKKLFSADAAVSEVINKQIDSIKKIKNEYIKERISDILDIKKKIIININNIKYKDINFSKNNDDIIIISKDISPSQIIQFNNKNIKGFLTEEGSITSHTSIIAKSTKIPLIIKIKNLLKKIKKNDYIIIDSTKNIIYINPNEKIKNKVKLEYKLYNEKIKKLKKIKKLPTITKDGYKIKLLANIGNNKDINNVIKNGAEGIGLYRTEFLFMNRNSFPTEEEQFEAYKEIAISMKNNPITIRTVDLGGDKFLPYMNFPKENIPYLGWRSIRIYKDRKEIIQTQLKAILRASIYGNFKIMFPMIISMEEVFFIKKEIKKTKIKLKQKNQKFKKNIKIGIMIETPSAAIIANKLAKELDFFSIGTNDLTQYTLAVDRNNSIISYLYNPLSPSMIHLIKLIIDEIHKENKKISICGELASDEKSTILLLGLGIDELSMDSNSIPNIKNIIRNLSIKHAKKITEKILSKSTFKEINKILQENILNK